MRVTVFSTKPYDRHFLSRANAGERHELVYLETHLDARTAPWPRARARYAPSSTTTSIEMRWSGWPARR